MEEQYNKQIEEVQLALKELEETNDNLRIALNILLDKSIKQQKQVLQMLTNLIPNK